MAQDQSRRGVIGGGRALVQWALSVCLALPCIPCFADQGDLRLEIETLPGFQRYDRLLEHPGYIAVALENIDIRPSSSTKLILRDRGREVEARNVILRFTGKTATSYSYEAGVSLGIGSASVTIPVTVDLSALPAGKTIVVAKLPLATLLSDEKRERIQAKVRVVADAAAQQKVLDYLDHAAKAVGPSTDSTALHEVILLDAYNRSGPATMGPDVGEALPLSEQWMLILTLAIWLILVPAGLLAYRLLRRTAR